MKKVRKNSVFKYTLLNVFGINIVGALGFFVVILILLSFFAKKTPSSVRWR
ncbi:MAG: hypothetical protein PWQ20_1719 [Thermotogaceae bacterium]|jgi:small-conductance mechanosensitive channel|nr:hypothetical protein [Thermotogaceae bacterium]MDN5338649.1 hypothetical protein [Thermotogaceae bacterium]